MMLPKRKLDKLGVSHRHSRKQEARIAVSVGGKTVVGSGAGREKGDVRKRGIVRIEAKTTQRKSFSVTRKLIEKIEDEATGCGELPAIAIDFIDENGAVEKSAYVIPSYALEDLIRQLDEHAPST